MKERFLKTMHALTELPLAQEEKLLKLIRTTSVARGEHFIREGQVPRQFGFIGKGLFRYYYVDYNGNEFTKGFFPEGTFLSSYSAMIQNRPSYFNIEALEPSEIITIDFQQWKSLSAEHPCWNTFLVAILEKAFTKKENREREFLLFDAETRYRSFLEEYPDLSQRVKQHMIASYLGITPVALSRVRRKMGVTHTT
ncbi:Crp/Fnr family transcriptional regulator [Fulvivirga sp. 29W222]|uniref:Crp/Fnr family transcriptional regulator n=1 Tax=Fulvivirga marina TaxID=2494733 RepID=A0A937FX34_9BACT|nr:Crp/Fnr family transcriptional regulator [Fulvivirga marina]MBL6446623.1 Crp/Fnr family transcriptional regulator [Fulvivirga marina]